MNRHEKGVSPWNINREVLIILCLKGHHFGELFEKLFVSIAMILKYVTKFNILNNLFMRKIFHCSALVSKLYWFGNPDAAP